MENNILLYIYLCQPGFGSWWIGILFQNKRYTVCFQWHQHSSKTIEKIRNGYKFENFRKIYTQQNNLNDGIAERLTKYTRQFTKFEWTSERAIEWIYIDKVCRITICEYRPDALHMYNKIYSNGIKRKESFQITDEQTNNKLFKIIAT